MSDSIDLVVLIIVAMLVQSPIFDVVIEVLVLYNRVDRVSSDSVQIAVIKQQETTNKDFQRNIIFCQKMTRRTDEGIVILVPRI